MNVNREEVGTRVKQILAELLERERQDFEDEINLQELGVDSLMFLEAFEQIKEEYGLNLDLVTLRAYLKNHPVNTLGEMVSGLHDLVTSGESFAELTA